MIDIISDPNCPFCTLGVLQLQKALEETGRKDTHLIWHPFFINPNLEAAGMDVRENLKAKYGRANAEIEAGFDRLAMQGEAFGFEYNFPKGKRVYPSDRAQQFIEWVPEDLRTKAQFALMDRFFTRSENFHSLDVLADIACELGLDGEEARHVIECEEFAQKINNDAAYWQAQGIQAVPSFIFDKQYFISGAIGVDGFKSIFEQIEELQDPKNNST